jgi:NitT/TauT family transport system substrate-binding protein
VVEMAPPGCGGRWLPKRSAHFRWVRPFPSQADGFGRVLFPAREHWPDFMSCVLVVRQDMIDQRPDAWKYEPGTATAQ